jgi:hypothetical protein
MEIAFAFLLILWGLGLTPFVFFCGVSFKQTKDSLFAFMGTIAVLLALIFFEIAAPLLPIWGL